jgi:hypothetical protein
VVIFPSMFAEAPVPQFNKTVPVGMTDIDHLFPDMKQYDVVR